MRFGCGWNRGEEKKRMKINSESIAEENWLYFEAFSCKTYFLMIKIVCFFFFFFRSNF